MKKLQINPEDLIKDLNKILENITLLEDPKITDKDLVKITKKLNKDSEKLKEKYKDLDTEK